MVSGFEQNGHFLSLTFSLNMIHCIQNGGTMTKITIAETKPPIHPNLSAVYLGDQMNQLAHALSQTTPAQDKPMPIHMTHKEFINAFANEGQALYYIDNIVAEGRIEVSENQVPYVEVKVNPDTNEHCAVEVADCAPVIHSFEIRIARWYEDDDSSADAIVRFEGDEGRQWFFENLWFDLQGQAESSDLYWDDYKTRIFAALVIQRGLAQKRLSRAKSRVGETPSHSPQFIAACREVVESADRLQRIEYALEGY